MTQKSERIKAEAKAFRLLTRRAHSEKELRAKLTAVPFSKDIVDDVVDKCFRLGYLNDEVFAKQRARSLALNRLFGDLKISADLKERGVSSEILQGTIIQIDSEIDEMGRIRKLIEKRRRANETLLSDERQKARLIRNLLSRGFSLALIRKTINEEEEAIS